MSETLDQLGAIHDAATKGPWHCTDGFGGEWVVDDQGGVPGGISAAIHPITPMMPGVVLGNVAESDALAIVTEHNTYAALLEVAAKAERVAAELDIIRTHHPSGGPYIVHINTHGDLRAALAALKAVTP